MGTLRLDLKHSLRTLRNQPGFVALVILLLALGIGANSAIFSVAHSVLLRPLPYAEPDRLVVALHEGNAPVSPADFLDYKARVKAFETIGAAQMYGATLSGVERPERIPALRVSANIIDLLGVAPLHGRSFRPEEEHEGRSNVVLLSYGLWRERFGGNPGIVGRTVLLDNLAHLVVGVMPPGFRFAPFWATRSQMWVPLVLDHRLDDRSGRSLRVFARLEGGVSVAEAQAEMDAVARQLELAYPQTNAKLGISVVLLHDKVVTSVRPTLLVLLGTVAFVLLIACATVGNLLLARAMERRREMALRLAVGARRRDLIRLALLEAFLLALLGGAFALLIANWAVESLRLLLPPASLPRQAELGFDRLALLFTAAVTMASAILAGSTSALQSRRSDVNADLKEGGRSGGPGHGSSWTRFALVATEVALSLLLMVGAGLMMRTMAALQSVESGFEPRGLATMQVAVSGTGYDRDGRRMGVFTQLRDRLAAMPGVESVGAINHLPVGGDIWTLRYTIDGRSEPGPGEEMGAVYRVVLPGYFRTMQIGLLQGRDFTFRDGARAPAVAVVNESMARRRWPGESPLGKTIRFGLSAEERSVPRMIVGVVRDARQKDWTSTPEDEIYLPYLQRPDSMGLSYLTFVLLTPGDPKKLAARTEAEIRDFDRALSVSEVATMEQIVSDVLWRQRLAASLIASFAGLALLLAAAGIYGVISHSIRQRTQEMGVRMALGARRTDLIRLVLWEGFKPVSVGILAGVAAALYLVRYMETLLYGVEAADPATLLQVVVLLLGVSLLANLVPALRATRLDPVIALRYQ
jgi:predicted permease